MTVWKSVRMNASGSQHRMQSAGVSAFTLLWILYFLKMFEIMNRHYSR